MAGLKKSADQQGKALNSDKSRVDNQHIIRLSRSILGEAEADAVRHVLLEDGYLGMGSEVARFEEEIAQFLGVDRACVVVVNSGTAALHLATAAVIEPGEGVLIPSLTYVASFQAVTAAGGQPVACDVSLDDALIDLHDAAARLNESDNCRAIMPVHYAGSLGDLEALYAFARHHKLRVIEDAAHTFGSTVLFEGCEQKVGTFGDIVCFSFDGIKNITSGEGGAVVTRDPEVAERVRNGRLLGVEKDTEARFRGGRSWEFEVSRPGYRYHMSNLFAAIGRVQLKRLQSEFGPKRQALVTRYRERLGRIEGVALLGGHSPGVIPHIMPIRVVASPPEPELGAQGEGVGEGGHDSPKTARDHLRHALAQSGVPSGIHYKPNHLLALYGGGQVTLPAAEQLYEELLTLPLHPGLNEKNIDMICDLVESTLSPKP